MKRLVVGLIVVFLSFSACAYGRDKPAILFNREKITAENVLDYSTVFRPNERIYYLVLIPKKIVTRTVEIQIIKQDNKYERLGYNLYWSRTAPLYDDEMYYYDDYVVIGEPGAYVMKVYSKDKPKKPLCMAAFFIRN